MALTQNQKYIIGGMLIVIIAALLIWRSNNGGGEQNAQQSGRENLEIVRQNGQPPENGEVSDEGSMENVNTQNTFKGTLKISDDLKRGNLMLETEERTIYVFTSRDYSGLIDNQVNLEIRGTLDNFTLLDIKPN